ncbi:MAG: YkgJ family cysteine cluster protein [Candidatus Eremiobacteraeota bacterium]|nr:YkgJ family cysteine cluster protein [Candidatus Eremiobacteraeota bacterium]
MHLLPGQNYDCLRCARSCTSSWRVQVDQDYVSRLLPLRLVEDGFEPREGGATLRLEGERCVFLDQGASCRIHAQLGATAKPSTCQLFPFLPVETPDGLFVGASFYCTAIAQNHGRPLVEHSQDIARLGPFPRVGFKPGQVDHHCRIDWKTYQQLEDELRRRLSGRGLGQAFWGLCWWLSGEPQAELVDLDAALAEGPADPFLNWLELACLRSLCARIEAPGAGLELLAALEKDQPVRLQGRFSGRPSELVAFMQQAGPSDAVEEVTTRYLEGLLFRKFLLLRPTVLENLLLMHMVTHLMRFYSAAFAMAAGRQRVESSDVFEALDLMELVLLTHSSEGFVVAPNLVRFYRERAETLRQMGTES